MNSPKQAAVILVAVSAILAGARAEDFPVAPSVYAHYVAGAEQNLVAPAIEEQFGTAQVNTAAGTLQIDGLDFAARTYPKGLGYAVPVWFSTNGRLPAPLEPGRRYFLAPAGQGGWKVYKISEDADAESIPGSVPGEKVLPAQNLEQGVGAIVFADAGAGEHTVHSLPMLRQFTDLTSNGFDSLSKNPADRHSMLEIDSDAAGRAFVRTAGPLSRENWVASYSGYGPTFFQGPAAKRFPARQQVGQKRIVYQIFVCRVRSFPERQVMKFLAVPEKVDVAADRVAYATDARMTNRVGTGDRVRVKTYGEGRLPAPLKADQDYFARKMDAKTLTLHQTAADAVSGTQPVDLTDPGAGEFLFWMPERVGDSRRWSFFAEVLAPDSGGNTLSARLQESIRQGSGILQNAKSFSASGSVAGLRSVPDLSPVSFWVPPGAKLPEPLKPGTSYWVTSAPGSGGGSRLHATLAEAEKSRGLPTAEAACLKFPSTGVGECLASFADGTAPIAFGTLSKELPTFKARLKLGELCVLVFRMDFDDPASEGPVASLGINELETEKIVLKQPKGLTPAAREEPYPSWTLFNSAQGHVPIDMDLYEIVFGSSANEVPPEDIQKMVDSLKARYGVGAMSK